MERNPYLQPEFNGGETFLPPATALADDEAFINGLYRSLSYQSVLSSGPPSIYASVSSSSSQFMQQTSSYIKTENDVQMTQKLEPGSDFLHLYDYEMFSNEPFNCLPDLCSLEHSQNHLDFQLSDSSGSQISNFLKPKRDKTPYAARVRRHKISEKTRILEKLMPWDRKMTTANMLEEAYKYIKFLQAQISVLHNMPLLQGEGAEDSNGKSSSSSVFASLERLNRQQLLQVVLNSPVAQTYFYSKACCLYSVEQLNESMLP